MSTMRSVSGFLGEVTSAFGRLKPQQSSGLDFLIGSMEDDPAMASLQYRAYALATVWHETGRKCQPIREWGSRQYLDRYDEGKLAMQLGNTPEDDDDGVLFCGRGFVQITGADNYRRFGKLLGVPLFEQPDLALDPEIAYRILSVGMTGGFFTGKKLSDYFGVGREDALRARRIINGMDKADRIAGYYGIFKAALQAGN